LGRCVCYTHFEIMLSDIKTVRNVSLDSLLTVIHQMLLRYCILQFIRMINFIGQWLWWSRGCVLASSTQVHGFKPGRSCRIFQGKNFPSAPSFGGEVKPAVPCRRFAACKRSLNVTWSRHLGKILGYSFSPIKVPPLAAWISHVA
jgi:hypothetical protein